MRRLKYTPTNAAADALDVQVAQMQPARKRRANGRGIFARSVEQAEAYRKAGKWDGASGRHLVALYAWLHEQIYGVAAAELLDGDAVLGAISSADKLLRAEFDGDAGRAVKFIAWCWSRERQRETSGRNEGRRVTWRLQFASRCMLTDYRVELLRGNGR